MDEIIFYKPLTKNDISHIIDLIFKDLNKRLAQQQLSCQITPSAKDFIAENGYDPLYGARPLKRYIQRNIETMIAKKIIRDDISPDTVMTIDVENNNFVVK